MSEALDFPSVKAAQGEMSLSVFEAISALAHSEAGLLIPSSKRALVQSRISRRLRALGLSDYNEYLKLVQSEDNAAERRNMVSVLTTNVSSFFRESHHFDTLENLAPELVARAREGHRIRVWSAGCSSGQEPYSIAMVLAEAGAALQGQDIKILASDIDPAILETARAGIYDETQMSGVSASRVERFFERQASGACRVKDALRPLIGFRELNLLKPWPMKGSFDVIFCRNVVIYFDEETQLRLWPRFRDLMNQDGLMFLGHSERVPDPASVGLEVAGVTTYRASTNSFRPDVPGAGPAMKL